MYAEGMQYKAEKNEQWKKEGKCSICRRVDYCKKDCTARKRNIMGIISNRFRRMTGADTIREILNNAGGKL